MVMTMDYEQKYKAALEWMQGMYGGLHGKTKEEAEKYFPELKESKDEWIRKWLIRYFEQKSDNNVIFADISLRDILAWLEKQSKPMWTDEDEKRLQSCIIALQGKGLMGGVDTIDTKWLKSLKQRIIDNSEKTCKNDTLLDLLNKMPSYITVDGIFYHFMLRKTALAYTAYYAGEEEGSGKVIFAMTAFSPIDLLTEMLEKLKEEGLLE